MEEHVVAIIGLILMPVSLVLTALWVTTRRRAQRAEAAMQQVAIALAAGRDRGSSRLESDVEALSREVDRIAEGQRFVTRLLEDTAVREVVAPAHLRSVTPH